MGRKRKIPQHPKRVEFVVKDPEELEAALQAELERLHSLYEKGHRETLLHAVDLLLRHHAMGSWVCQNFAQRFEAWCRWETPDLAVAFGVKRDRKKVPEARRREALRGPIVSAIINRRRRGILTEEAIEQTAKEFEMSESFVAKLYSGSPGTQKLVENLPTLRFLEGKPKTRGKSTTS